MIDFQGPNSRFFVSEPLQEDVQLDDARKSPGTMRT